MPLHRPAIFGALSAGLLLASAMGSALAQVPDTSSDAAASKLVTVLTIGLPCAAQASTREAIQARSLEAAAPDEDLQVALARISSDETFCEPIRNAASMLAADLTVAAASQAQASDREALTASASLVAEALDEADKRASEQRFKVEPPPRNLTRGRISGS